MNAFSNRPELTLTLEIQRDKFSESHSALRKDLAQGPLDYRRYLFNWCLNHA